MVITELGSPSGSLASMGGENQERHLQGKIVCVCVCLCV